MDTLQFVEVARQVRRVKDIKCNGNVSGSEQKQSSEYAPCCPVLAALVCISLYSSLSSLFWSVSALFICASLSMGSSSSSGAESA